jgi:hypothetical protein
LRSVLDDSNTGFVTVYKFAEFMKPFGPLPESINKVGQVIAQPWFHGYLSRVEAEKLLEPFQDGTFLVRFAESSPGAFAVGYVADKTTVHINIETLSGSFAVAEGDSECSFVPLFVVGCVALRCVALR